MAHDLLNQQIGLKRDMSNLGNYLKAFLDRHPDLLKKKKKHLAAAMGIVASHLSAILRGKRTSFNIETVAKMTKGISSDPKEQAEFLTAYLLDQCPAQARRLVTIQPRLTSGRIQQNQEECKNDAFHRFAEKLRQLGIDHDVLDNLMHLAVTANENERLACMLNDLVSLDIKPTSKKSAKSNPPKPPESLFVLSHKKPED